MNDIVIIADDFTSVTDCATPFAQLGMSAAALINLTDGSIPQVQVLGVNTDSRTLPSAQARNKNLKVTEKLRQSGYSLLYKSIDSTLRGNIGAEIDGVMEGGGFSLALIAPAFPHYGRVTLKGIHYLNGQRLENSPIARDPSCPAKESEIRKIIGLQSPQKTACIALNTVRLPSEAFAKRIKALQKQGYMYFVLDVETEADLNIIAGHTACFEKCLIVGSTGLARHLAIKQCSGGTEREGKRFRNQKPVIVAAASASPVTAEQIQVMAAEGGVKRYLISPAEAAFGDISPLFHSAQRDLADGMDVIFQIDASPKVREEAAQVGRFHGISQNNMGFRIARALAGLSCALLDLKLSESIVMTGGDMAQAILTQCASEGMELYGEVEPGIPLGRLMGSFPYLAVTKAGAFGTPRALSKARQMLKNSQS